MQPMSRARPARAVGRTARDEHKNCALAGRWPVRGRDVLEASLVGTIYWPDPVMAVGDVRLSTEPDPGRGGIHPASGKSSWLHSFEPPRKWGVL